MEACVVIHDTNVLDMSLMTPPTKPFAINSLWTINISIVMWIIITTGATDALVLEHQGISSTIGDYYTKYQVICMANDDVFIGWNFMTQKVIITK